jgi:hypothetical protein
MDGATVTTRKYPSYTTKQLESMVDIIKKTDDVVSLKAIQDEIDRRKAGLSVVKPTPQIAGGKIVTRVGRL